jgi:hypothetical protein
LRLQASAFQENFSVISPSAVCFGLLVFGAVFLGMYGDLVLMQSLILTSAPVRNLISRLVIKEFHKENSQPPATT